MSELTFSQPERRNGLLVPLLIAFVVIGAVFAYIYLRPHRIADITVSRPAIVPEHTVYKSLSKVVGHEDEAQDDLYVITTVSITNRLSIPLTIDTITGTITPPDDSTDPTPGSAIEKTDLDNLFITFPALKPLSSAPLVRETTIPPGGHAEGMVLLHFPIAQADWDKRKSASVTLKFYDQPDALTVALPKGETATANP
jgi:hypothetical protein